MLIFSNPKAMRRFGLIEPYLEETRNRSNVIFL